MKLYRIRNINTKKYFVCDSHRDPVFNSTGAFFKKIETIDKHLRRMTHKHKYQLAGSGLFYHLILTDFLPEIAEVLEVEITNVTVLNRETIPAMELLKKGAIDCINRGA